MDIFNCYKFCLFWTYWNLKLYLRQFHKVYHINLVNINVWLNFGHMSGNTKSLGEVVIYQVWSLVSRWAYTGIAWVIIFHHSLSHRLRVDSLGVIKRWSSKMTSLWWWIINNYPRVGNYTSNKQQHASSIYFSKGQKFYSSTTP